MIGPRPFRWYGVRTIWISSPRRVEKETDQPFQQAGDPTILNSDFI
jgi:hypothetical protein